MLPPIIQEKRLPKSKLSRLAHLGAMASGVVGNMLLEGGKQWALGKRPRMQDLIVQHLFCKFAEFRSNNQLLIFK